MKRYELRGNLYTINELSEMSGIAPATLRDRLRRGYSVNSAIRPFPIHDSVEEFCAASWWNDWIGMSITDLHKIYWRWSIQQGYSPLQTQGFSRQLMSLYPMLKIVPNRIGKPGNTCTYQRVIRLREG